MKTKQSTPIDTSNDENVQFDRIIILNRRKISFDDSYIERDLAAAELFLSRLIGERIEIENIQYGNLESPKDGSKYTRGDKVPIWRKIEFRICFFNGDSQLAEANNMEDQISISYGDFM